MVQFQCNSTMATPTQTRVQFYGDDTEPLFEDNSDHRDFESGSNDETSDDGGENGGDGEEGEDKEAYDNNVNAGWAEAMAKVLGKQTPESKSSILVKNKELEKMKEREKQEHLEKKKQVDKTRVWEMMCREKPDIVKDRENERALQRTATRGVVQLFNAVRKYQKTVDDKVKKVGGSERKKAKILSSVSKKDFISVLRRAEGSTGRTEKDTAAAAEEKPAWTVLREDYMMGATMKDWDKDSDREEADAPTGWGLEESDSD